jgi:predicted RNA-binding Zn ribbon-like protein
MLRHSDHHSDHRPGSLTLVAGRLALDFSNTESGRGTHHHLDHLKTGLDVLTWSRHAQVLGGGDAAFARKAIGADRGLEQQLVKRGKALRATIYAINSSFAAGQKPNAKMLSDLTDLHHEMFASARLVTIHGSFDWRWDIKNNPLEGMLGPLSLSALAILRNDNHSRIKQCKGLHCGWLFYDETKNNSRQWCDMAVCGNRAKASAHRERLRHAG